MVEPMFAALCRGTSFPSSVRVPYVLNFTASELAHALFTTGRIPGDQTRYGPASVWEFIHRVSVIPAYVRRTNPGDRLVRSQLALDLDRSEKVALSYALGMSTTGIFCRRVIGVQHAMHLDRYGARFGMDFGPTRRRPDLFGRGPIGWVVAEAKGRSNGMESTLQAKLAAQKRSVRLIEGAPPALALGCVASFPPKTQQMRLDAFDPVEAEKDALDLEVDRDRFYLAYYEPFLAALEVGVPRPSEAYEVSDLLSVGVQIGLRRDISAVVRSAVEARDATGLAERVVSLLASDEEMLDVGFPDGSVFGTAWPHIAELEDWKA